MIKAINPKHQKAVTKAYNKAREYHELVNRDRDALSARTLVAVEARQERAYDALLDLLEELPARERSNLNKQHKEAHGYEL